MRKRFAVGFAIAAAFSIGMAGMAPEPKVDKGKKWIVAYGHDLKVRSGGQTDWAKAAQIGVEVFQIHDPAAKATIGISETGAISVFPFGPIGNDKRNIPITGHDLGVRKIDEPQFTQKTKKWGVEVFHDLGSNRLLYVSQAAGIAFAPTPGNLMKDKGPKWHHGLVIRVRGVKDTTFENAKRIGLEVFKDENTGGLIYITDTGMLATSAAPPKPPDPKKVLPPNPLYGYTLPVRTADEPEFTENKTKKISVEVFEDPNANVILYMSDAGSVATAPNRPLIPGRKGEPIWKMAMNLPARKGGVKEWTKARKFGIEVFEDVRTGNLIYISETGAIAVLPK